MSAENHNAFKVQGERNRFALLWYAGLAFAISVALVVGGHMVSEKPFQREDISTFLYGVSGSIVGSLIFWRIFLNPLEALLRETNSIKILEETKAAISAISDTAKSEISDTSTAAKYFIASHSQHIPSEIYAGGHRDKSDPRFESHLRKILESRPDKYYFVGESALTASSRLFDTNWRASFEDAAKIYLLVIDPRDEDTLEIQARHRLAISRQREKIDEDISDELIRLMPSNKYCDPDINRQICKVKLSIFKTIDILLPFAGTKYDLTFLDGPIFFRTELFEPGGLFLAHYEDIKIYPWTSFYPDTSPTYEAHKRSIRVHFESSVSKISLSSLKKKLNGTATLKDVLDELGLGDDFHAYERWISSKATKTAV